MRLCSCEREPPRDEPVASNRCLFRFASSQRDTPRDEPVASNRCLFRFASSQRDNSTGQARGIQSVFVPLC